MGIRIDECSCFILRPKFANGGGQDYLGGGVFGFDRFDGGKDWLATEQHAIATTVGSVVDRFVRAETKVAQIDKIKPGQAFFGGFPHHGGF